jgi:hypothetical protein
MSKRASVQVSRLQLEAIGDDIVQLAAGQYRAVLEVEGIHFGLLGAVEQEALLAGFGAWLNSLGYPVQVLAQVTPLDLDQYLGALAQRARHDLPAALVALAHDHMTFLQGLARERTLLERHLYVIVPAGDGGPARRWPLGTTAEQLDAAGARRQLTARCAEVTGGLGRCRLTVRRLANLELAQLLYACWCPERARLQRLRAELAEYAALAVRRHPSPERST